MIQSGMNRDKDFLLKQIKDEKICGAITASLLPQRVSFASPDMIIAANEKGFPISANPTWNACYNALFGTYTLTKFDIQNNPDVDKNNTPRDCAYYFELASGTVYYPDTSVYFTVDYVGKATFPAGYIVAPQSTVAGNL